MVQSVDNSFVRPNYSAVKINIKNPELNTNEVSNIAQDDANGNYNAVNIEIDHPTVKSEPKKIYDYPTAKAPLTYEQAQLGKVALPEGFHVAYQTTNVILPKIENEVELADKEKEVEDVEAEETEAEAEAEEVPVEDSDESVEDKAEVKDVEVPAPNYTTIEAEKGDAGVKNLAAIDSKDEVKTDEVKENDEVEKEASVEKDDAKEVVEKKPIEIVSGEEIKPDVDISLVVSNLTNKDFDVQAQQMEEIARVSLDNSENAVPYIVRDVFANLIDIAKKDSSELAAPTDAQIAARKKMIANYLTMEVARAANKPAQPPYQLTEAEISLANEISPMEQAERNKEYALYTIAILDKVYTDEVEKQTGNIVPMTDIPGTSAIVDALRYNPNSGVKVAAIDALRHIQRPEYKEELTTLYTLAQADTNRQVAETAARALQSLNEVSAEQKV